MVGVGIEPTFRAFRTRANPSQLSDRRLIGFVEVTNLERAVRFELTIPDLQSGALGRLATRAKLERKERIELSNRVWKTRMFPATSLPQVVGEDRIELSPRVPKTRMLALHHTPKNFGGTDETRTRDLCIDSAAL